MKKILFTLLLLAFQFNLLSQNIRGIDVSHHQGTINWQNVYDDNIVFAYVKSSEGMTYQDPKFQTNMNSGSNAGLIMGAYHFARPGNNTATQDANNFVITAGTYMGEGYLPPVLDIESRGSNTFSQLSVWCQSFLTFVENETGVRPVIYMNGTYANNLNSSLNTYELWIANFETNQNTPPSNTGNWNDWAIKQYSELGSVYGIYGNVDLDVFHGSMNDFNDFVVGGRLDCSNAAVLNCGVTYHGSSSNSNSNVTTYGCNNWSETGPERVHTITPTSSGTLTATISNYSGDLDVYILGSCDPTDCLGTLTSSSATYANAQAGHTYYVIVDADDGSGSSYDLNVECPITSLDCFNATALNCGVTYHGSNSTTSSNVTTYGCNNWTETGPERVHSITPASNGILTANISNYSGDLDVYILGSCDPSDCVGTLTSSSASFSNAQAGHTYYIVVDADDGSGSSYDLIVDCPVGTDLNCYNAIPLNCGVSYHGGNSSASSNITTYGCNSWTETGPERVHSITPASNGTLTANISNYSGDLDVYILGSCDPSDCLGTVYSSSSTYNNVQAGHTYYIVVDADDGSGSPYDLIVNCSNSHTIEVVTNEDTATEMEINITKDISLYNEIITTSNTVHAGETIHTEVMQHYNGNFESESSIYLYYYISTDCILDNLDTYLGKNYSTINTKKPIDKVSSTLTIPNDTSPGNYYILFVSDATDRVDETDESNNMVCTRIVIDKTTILETSDFDERISVFPNPVGTLLNYKTDSTIKIKQIVIINHLGQIVKSSGKPKRQIDVSNLPSGVYLIKFINDNNEEATFRIIKR